MFFFWFSDIVYMIYYNLVFITGPVASGVVEPGGIPGSTSHPVIVGCTVLVALHFVCGVFYHM